jgi:hypothetical protein
MVVDLLEFLGERADERRKLSFEVAIIGHCEVPAIVREPAVSNVRDSPAGCGFEIEDEVDIAAINAVGQASAKDDLPLCRGSTSLLCYKAHRDQDGIEGRSDQVENRIVGRNGKRSPWQASIVAPASRLKRPRTAPGLMEAAVCPVFRALQGVSAWPNVRFR